MLQEITERPIRVKWPMSDVPIFRQKILCLIPMFICLPELGRNADTWTV